MGVKHHALGSRAIHARPEVKLDVHPTRSIAEFISLLQVHFLIMFCLHEFILGGLLKCEEDLFSRFYICVIIVAFLENATIGYSLESLCVCVCVRPCLCVCVFAR